MSAIGTILSFVGPIASIAYPPAAPFIAFIQKAEPYAETAIPLLQDAVKGGPEAFSAFKEAAPEFTQHLRDFASFLKTGSGGELAGVSDHELATLGAHIAGVDPPGWTHDETQRWWDQAQGGQAS